MITVWDGFESRSVRNIKKLNQKCMVMSRSTLKVLRIAGKLLAVITAIVALMHNVAYMYAAALLWFGSDELCVMK